MHLLLRLLKDAQAVASQEQEAIVLNSIATLYTEEGKYQDAWPFYQDALTIFESLGSDEGREAIFNNTGDWYHRQNRLQDAADSYQSALDLARSLEDREGEATDLGNLGVVYMDWGRYEEALRHHFAALAIRQQSGDLSGQAHSHNALAAAYDSLGSYEEAITQYEAALALRQRTGEQVEILNTLNNLGVTFFKLGRYSAALSQYKMAYATAQGLQTPLMANVLDNMGTANAHLGHYSQALVQHFRALQIYRKIGNSAGEAIALSNIGWVYHERQSYRHALTEFRTSLRIFEKIQMPEGQIVVLHNIGRTYQKQGNLAEAMRAYEKAVMLFETLQGEVKTEELAQAYNAQQSSLYSHLIDSLVAAGNEEAAFDYAERARARAFLNQIGNRRIKPQSQTDPALIAEGQALDQEIAGLQTALNNELHKPAEYRNRDALRTLNTQREEVLQKYAQWLVQIKLVNPEYASLFSIDTLGLAKVSQIVDKETTLIEYFVLEDTILAWVIDSDGSKMVRLNVGGEILASQVRYLHSLIERRRFDDKVASELYGQLVAPLQPYIRHRNLIIVPHGVLHYLPFAALWNADTQRYLIQDYILTYAPSASVLRFIQNKRNANKGRLLAMGNPDGFLSYAETEVEAIADLYGAAPLLQSQATESQFRELSPQADIVHLAAHGIYNSFSPLFTRIELAVEDSNNGYLEVHEVYGLNLTEANLVVLSACKSALGEQSQGDEIVGLTRAFLYAGTPLVVTTLWTIDDEASGALMLAFYRHLHEGLSTAEALRQAQLEVIEQNRWQSPYYWAAFVLNGDGG